MNRDQKTVVIDEIADQIQSADAIFAVDYRGISVAQVGELRAKLRDADARFRVVKNSLTERAADKAGMETLKPMLVGPTALAFVHGDAAQAAKTLSDTARRLNRLDFKGGMLNGSALSADDVRSIARLPAREVLHAQLVGTIAAPLTGLVRGLNALIAGVAIALQAIVDQGLLPDTPGAAVAVEAPAEPAAGAGVELPFEPEAGAADPQPEPEAEPEAELPEEPAQTQESDIQAASDAAPSDE
jgi:large subunit ribosomal protein L10